MKGTRRTVRCPGRHNGKRCAAPVEMRESRPTDMERVFRVGMWRCARGHYFDTALTVVGEVRERAEGGIVWRHSTRTARRLREAAGEEFVS